MKGGPYIENFRFSNLLCTWAITNYASIEEYQLCFFPRNVYKTRKVYIKDMRISESNARSEWDKNKEEKGKENIRITNTKESKEYIEVL